MNLVNNISAIADGKEQIRVRTNYSEIEIAQFNSLHMQNAIKINKIKEAIKDLNSEKKSITDESSKLIEKAHLGFNDEEIQAFYIDDQFEGERKYYNENGIQVNSRKLLPNEKINIKLAFNN